jgi:oxygen-independent coproporphyrinogen-3 oxidase
VRWWNLKHPRDYAARLAMSRSPAAAREVLSDDDKRIERVMLALRLRDGLALSDLDDTGRAAAVRAGEDGLLEPDPLAAGRAVLSFRGRLLADAVVRGMIGP